MFYSAEQLKGKIKNLAKQNNADARVLIRIYMMERFLCRLAASSYAENFIVKGGILVTSMVGISMRSTMDIDTSLKNLELSKENAVRVAQEIADIDLQDGIRFQMKEANEIMDDMEYPGIRITIEATTGNMSIPLKIDISTGDVITPQAIQYEYKLMLDNQTVQLWSYNLETILAEKLQTVLARGILNTRMRDYYDIRMLLSGYAKQIDEAILKQAFLSTCKKRESMQVISAGPCILEDIVKDATLQKLWVKYQEKYSYASGIEYDNVVDSLRRLYDMAAPQNEAD